jgi:hypothetical protein
MIRCIRLWSGLDGRSHFEEGVIGPSRRIRTRQYQHLKPVARAGGLSR